MTPTTNGPEPRRIEGLYHRYGAAGGQQRQLDLPVTAADIGEAFESTVTAVSDTRGNGSFFPPGTRKGLFDLCKERPLPLDALCDTQHLQALLWSPPRWPVEGRPELEFMFVDREITPASAVVDRKREWIYGEDWRVSADLLLMNTRDRTPIVAEFKRGGDENADYALVQALAAAAQLTPSRQRARLRKEYSDHFGEHVPNLLDVYVILADPARHGTGPKLLERALAHAEVLRTSRRLDRWIRRVVFLEVKSAGGELTFHVLEGA